jgi:DNA-binding NtrC family response regulator
LTIPPLRERISDVEALVAHAMRSAGGKPFSPEAITALQTYDWPGNVRELIREVHIMAALCELPQVSAEEVLARLSELRRRKDARFPTLDEMVARVKQVHVRHALELTKGIKKEAAGVLGISRTTLDAILQDMQPDRPPPRH